MSPIRTALRGHPAVRQIVASWRNITGGDARIDADRGTLVACSGGADSSALAIALATTPARIRLAHIIHDMRTPAEANADAERVTELGVLLGVETATASIEARPDTGNLEAASRRLRYAALHRIAEADRFPFVVTGHHQDDQAETVLMRLVRGVGTRGIASIRTSRSLGPNTTLIRPMLGVSRQDAEDICNVAGWTWAEDATNADGTRLRSAIRRRVLPLLEELNPGAVAAIARSGAILGEQATVIDRARRALQDLAAREENAAAWPRELLRSQSGVVLGALLMVEAPTANAADRRSIIRALHDDQRHERTFRLGSMRLRIDASTVRFTSNPTHASPSS